MSEHYPRRITTVTGHSFTIEQDGLYSIAVTARCQSGKQSGKKGGEDLRIEIDGRKFRELPPRDKPQYQDIPPAWNGTQLKGLSKTVILLLRLNKGEHTLVFVPQHGAVIEREPIITRIENPPQVIFDVNEQAEDGDRRPWYTFTLIDVPVKSITADSTVAWRFRDSDDVKLIIDNNIKKNSLSILHRDWVWSGSVFKKFFGRERREKTFAEDLERGTHYVEFWADRMPVLHTVKLEISAAVPLRGVQLYSYRGVTGDEDYNWFDAEITAAVSFWNTFFQKQLSPPPESLDPNVVKAMMYKESRMGYAPGGFPDVIQVGDERNPAIHSIRGEEGYFANEFISEIEIGHINYSYPDEYVPPQVTTPRESIFWGVRWLYHTAQYLQQKTKTELVYPYVRMWNSWQEAVVDYNGNPALSDTYQRDVWRIYQDGIDPQGNVLWRKEESKGVKTFLFLFLFVGFVLGGVLLHAQNRSFAEELPWHTSLIQTYPLEGNRESLGVLQDITSGRVELAVLDGKGGVREWLPSGQFNSPSFAGEPLGEYFDWWEVADFNHNGLLDIAIQLQLSGSSLTHPFYLYEQQGDSFTLLLSFVDGVSGTRLVDFDGDGVQEIVHTFVLDSTNVAGRKATPWREVWAWRGGAYRQANHEFPVFLSEYRTLIADYDDSLAHVESYPGYGSVVDCLKQKAEINIEGAFADGRECL